QALPIATIAPMVAKMSDTDAPSDLFTAMLRVQGEAARPAMAAVLPEAVEAMASDESTGEWGDATRRVQAMWLEFHAQQSVAEMPVPLFAEPAQWLGLMQGWYQQMPWLDPQRQQQLFAEGAALWEDVLAQYGLGPRAGAAVSAEPHLPRTDRRFADDAWRKQPVFALIHQTYLLLAERILEAIDAVEGLEEREREQLRFATRSVLDAMSPANFPLTNPVVLERTI